MDSAHAAPDPRAADPAAALGVDVETLVTEDDTPVDDMPSEKQQRLLTEPLYSSWSGPGAGRTFLAAANVGVFPEPRNPAIVPDVFLSVLLEHKAAPDPGTPLQMLGYMVRIWQRHAEGRASRLRALPPIVPLIFYHGRTRWSGALSVAEMIAGEGDLAAFARRLCCVLHDLGERPLAELSGDPAVWSGLAALVAAFRGQPEEGVLRRILSGVPDGSELELQVLSYIVRTYELTPTVLETAARAAKPQRWEALMSTVRAAACRPPCYAAPISLTPAAAVAASFEWIPDAAMRALDKALTGARHYTA